MDSDQSPPLIALQEIADVVDSLHATPSYVPSGIPMVRVTDVKDGFLSLVACVRVSSEVFSQFTRNHVPRQGDIVISRVGTYGVFSYVNSPEPFCLGQNTAIIHPHDDSRYVYYALCSPETRRLIESRVVGSTQKTLSLRHIRELAIPFPSKIERSVIASTLGSLDDKIEQNRRTGRALEDLARATFKAWFVDFEAVKAKAAGHTSFPGMPAETFAMLPTRFVDSVLGHVPEGWKVGSLGDIVGLLQGFAFKSKDWSGSGVPVVKIGSIKPGIVDLSAVSFVSEEIAIGATKYRLAAGDLLIGMTGYVGEVGLIPPTQNLPLLNQRVSKVIFRTPGTRELGFAYCFMRREEFKTEVEAKAHGTAQANVSVGGILSVPLVIPSPVLYETFNGIAKELLNSILASLDESAKLAALRDYLLPRLLSGRVRVAGSDRVSDGVEYSGASESKGRGVPS